jgi:3-oxoacyl-[acyl-carrier-protein] synthase-3
MPASHLSVARRSHFVKMKGREVYRFAVHAVPVATREVLSKAELPIDSVDLLIPHQANRRILEAATRNLGVADDVVYSNVERFGNTSAASIPIAICEAIESGRISPGNLVVCVGFGAGLTWGAAAIRWTKPQPAPLTGWRLARRRAYYALARTRSRLRRAWRSVGAWAAQPGNGRGVGK